MEPRYFWRRLIAIIIDFIFLSQLAFYMVSPFSNGDNVRLSGGIYQSVSCQTVPLAEESSAYFEARGVSAENGNLCWTFQNGFFAGSDLLVSSETNADGNIADTATTLSVALDAQGQEIEPAYPVSYIAPIVVILGIILMTWLGSGQTLGKKLAGVRVLTSDDRYPSLFQVARRETLKFLPWILTYALGFFIPASAFAELVPNLQNGENLTVVLGFLGVSTFVYILWWVAPLVWWNGAMPYDQINKTLVERS